MTYAVDMGSRAMIYIPNFTKIGSAIQKFVGGHTDSMAIAYAYLYFFKLRKVCYFSCAGGLVYLYCSPELNSVAS
jgi:hypothetical protein